MIDQERILNILGQVDEKYIEEAQPSIPHIQKKKPLLIAACLVIALALCGFAYAAIVYWGVGSADNLDFDDLTKPFGTIVFNEESNSVLKDVFGSRSNIIMDYNENDRDNSVRVILEGSSIPSIYFSPSYMVIFTQTDEQGWMLKEGQELSFDLSLNEQQSLTLEYGYVFNGQYHELHTAKGTTFRDTLKATEDGEYYIWVINRSSSNAVIVNGIITELN